MIKREHKTMLTKNFLDKIFSDLVQVMNIVPFNY